MLPPRMKGRGPPRSLLISLKKDDLKERKKKGGGHGFYSFLQGRKGFSSCVVRCDGPGGRKKKKGTFSSKRLRMKRKRKRELTGPKSFHRVYVGGLGRRNGREEKEYYSD